MPMRKSEIPAATPFPFKLTARDLFEMGLIDGIIPEHMGGAHQNHAAAIANLKTAVSRQLDDLTKIPHDELLAQRDEKFRRFGEFAGDE